jgi:hypothetical protein
MKRVTLFAILALVILIPFTLTGAQESDPGGTERLAPPSTPQEPDTIYIEIVADADSVIAVPSVVTVQRGQVVTWISELGEWTVKFKSSQPFGDRAVGEGIRGNRGQRRGQAVRQNAAEGRYKYDIMVRLQGGQNLRADPEIVIGPGGTR